MEFQQKSFYELVQPEKWWGFITGKFDRSKNQHSAHAVGDDVRLRRCRISLLTKYLNRLLDLSQHTRSVIAKA